ncbi:MAG: hypothetical protein DHS20C16_03380 [Phycisphaerae bacterium]|nr:MAG: hypothetical protein DHS20C16_03380 [Phycisphaerae bacterium]
MTQCEQSINRDAVDDQSTDGGASPTCSLNFWVTAITRAEAKQWCKRHPHASSVPNSSKHYYKLELNGAFAGLAVWGYGVRPACTARKLFGSTDYVPKYLELCRFFVVDACPKNTASKFLSLTHRLLRRDDPDVGLLYTYAAGFQGLVGTIYQAANYDYIGTQECKSFLLVGTKLYHIISLWHADKSWTTNPAKMQDVFPGCKRWHGYNFRYVYWQNDTFKQQHQHRFTTQPYPTTDDIDIWTVDHNRQKAPVSLDFAKQVMVSKLHSNKPLTKRRQMRDLFPDPVYGLEVAYA